MDTARLLYQIEQVAKVVSAQAERQRLDGALADVTTRLGAANAKLARRRSSVEHAPKPTRSAD